MPKTAVLWIRDGVLIDRMPINAVAFAVACLEHADPCYRGKTGFTDLVNFAFQTSGIACSKKMEKFNEETAPLVADIAAAAAFYNQLAASAASNCNYFPAACDLVARLANSGVLNFITSAVEQNVLDDWAKTSQGRLVMPHLTEVIGKRSADFEKGRAHFEYIVRRYQVGSIHYVADAEAEIATGAKYSKEFNINTVGFAHVITASQVRTACAQVLSAYQQLTKSGGHCEEIELDDNKLALPNEATLQKSLRSAGAMHIVAGAANRIMRDLSGYFETNAVFATHHL